MNGSFLINQVMSCILPYTSQIAKKLLYSVPHLQHDFMIANSQIKFSCSENIGDVPGTYQWWSAMLV